MNTYRNAAKVGLTVVLAAVAVAALSSPASAGPGPKKKQLKKFQLKFDAGDAKLYAGGDVEQKYLLPGDQPQPHRRTLGFYGHIDPGQGMHVDRVLWGSRAEQIGLEAGDMIVSIDGRCILSRYDYHRALDHAYGRTSMVVRDVRGRGYVQVVFYLDDLYDSGHVLYIR